MNVFRKILCPVDPARGARGWADLIVRGTHGLSSFERLLLGSVTAKILAVAEECGAALIVLGTTGCPSARRRSTCCNGPRARCS
jgi:nucleotide-binding universal stress UspA family protein